jgi:hypothetical protein
VFGVLEEGISYLRPKRARKTVFVKCMVEVLQRLTGEIESRKSGCLERRSSNEEIVLALIYPLSSPGIRARGSNISSRWPLPFPNLSVRSCYFQYGHLGLWPLAIYILRCQVEITSRAVLMLGR